MWHLQDTARAKRQARLAQALKLYRDVLAKHPGALLLRAVTYSTVFQAALQTY